MRAGAELAGRYRLEEPVRRGGGGEVWQGVDLFLGRPVAVRVPPVEPPEDERVRAEALEHLRRRSRAALELLHPGIAPVQDVGEHEGRPFLVLDPWGGRDLGTELERAPDGLPVGTVLDYGAQVADALAAAHSAGLVHGEVKPSCVLLSDDGTVKLCDFGITALREPEKAGALDERADLHSLGATLFCLLTGREAASAGEAPSARALRRGVLPELDRRLSGLLAGGPDGPGRAVEVVETLRRAHVFYEPRYRLRLLAEAERIAWSIPLWHHRMPVLRGLVEVLAEEDPAEAERIARTVAKPDLQASLLLAIAGRCASRAGRPEKLLTAVEALAYAAQDPESSRDAILRDLAAQVAVRDQEAAERLVRSLSAPEARVHALCDLAGSGRAPERAGGLLLEAAELVSTISDTSSRVRTACRVARALVEHEPRAARRLLADAERAARADDAVRGGGRDGDLPPLNGRLVTIVETLAELDPGEAERIARGMDDPELRDGALARVAAVLARSDPAAAERLARTIDGASPRDTALGAVAEALAEEDPDGARRLIAGIEDAGLRVTLWLVLVRAQSGRDPAPAERIARAIPDPESRARRLCDVAEALRAEDPRRARDLLAEAARLPLGVFALCEVVGSLAGVDPLEAEHLARGMEDPARRARALRNIATALTVTDPCRARDLLAEAEYLARALVRPHDRDTVLREVVQALVELDPYDAERLAHAIGSAEQQASALVDIAATLARYDAPPARCESAGDRPRGQEREPLNA